MAQLKDLIVTGAARIIGKLKATSIAGDGSEITNINAGNISSGTLPVGRGGTGATDASNARANLGITPANIGAATASHNQASNTINAMTGYSKASSIAAISASDSLNTAIGKLEKTLDNKQNAGSYAASSHTHDDRYYTESEIDTKLNTKLNTSLKGAASGLAELDSTGRVPSSQLPSYVDDVIEGYLYDSKFYKESAHTTQITGETGKIYVDLTSNKTYRWSGSAFVVISETLALGETSTTAYRGDRGKTAYDHSQSTHARTDATKVEKSSTNGNIKINGTETTVYTHPSGTNPHGTTKSDVGLGNVDNTADASKNVKSSKKLQTYKQGSTTETYGDNYPIYAQWRDSTHVKMKCDNYTVETDYATTAGNADTSTKATQDESGNNIKSSYASSISISDHTITLKNKNGASLGTVTVPDNNTWRGIQNNLTSDSTTDSLSAAQGKVLKGLVDGKAASSHTHSAYVNQNAFSNVTVGSTTVSADSATDTLTLVAGSNVTLTPDATNDKITISSTNTDTKVTQTAISSADYTNWRSLIWGASNSGTEGFTPSTVTDGVYTCNTLSVQPSSGTIKANVFKGNLSGNVTGNVTGNVSGSSGSCTGNAATSTKLQTARSIALGTAVTSTATNFDGSANITIPVTGVKEAYLTWGGGNFSGSYGCIDAAMIPDLGANRLAFGKASGITVEYSRDGGSTWTDYGATDSQKAGLLGTGFGLRIGKADSNNKATADYKLRITLDTDKIPVYTTLNKFAIYVSTEGSTGSYCTIEASLESTPSTFVTFADRVAISGWSGWNIINTSGITTYGNSASASSQYGLIRFTFGCTGGSTTYNGLNIIRIMGFGGVGWTTPSNMAQCGTIYAYNSNQEVSFPAKVAAPSFSGALSGNATTATSLQNARTINGTSFNGSANITTANWGTARNIYITDADGTNTGDGVSVNGAGNATLKLPSTIKATLSGNASTATTLANARTIQTNLGSTSSASFNGGANITPGVTGTLPVANGGTGATTLTSGAALIGNGTGAISTRSITNMTTKSYIDYNTNLMTTNTLAYWNGAYASNNASNLTYCNKGAFGDAAVKGVDTTATSGSTNLITSGAMYTALSGKAASNHTHSYLPLSGGTLTGRLSADGKITLPSSAGSWINGMTLSNASIQVSTQQTTSSYHPYFAVKTNGNHVVNIGGIGDRFGFYGFKSGRTENATDWSFTFDVSSGSISSTHTITAPTFSGALSGNASTATKLATARTIALTGSVTGSGTFDGSGNLSIATTTNHTHSYAGSSSAGGSANSAVKLDSNAGSATQPIYFSGGKPTACSYTLSKSVPSDAKFTDTTYSTGTESTSGLTKLYTVIGTATDGTMTQNAITTELNKKSKVTIVRWS